MGKSRLFDLALSGYRGTDRGEGKGEARKAESLPMPEAQAEADPDEFAAHVEMVRRAWPDGPPLVAQDMPDWSAFCAGWWRDCFLCPCFDGSPNGSPCALWEAAFPGAVRWYPPTC